VSGLIKTTARDMVPSLAGDIRQSWHKLSPTHQLPVGGGDDNALSITTLTFDQEDPVINTVSVPNAHASAITAIKIVHVSSSSGQVYIASSGNDQRVKL
jgi:hypothetical protein